jgi:hypothetical protein
VILWDEKVGGRSDEAMGEAKKSHGNKQVVVYGIVFKDIFKV